MILISNPDKSQWQEILKRPVMNTENLFDTVRSVIDRVKEEGDRAVLDYEEKFDKVMLASLAVSEEEQQEAENLVSEDLKAAIRLAKQNIETFHAAQRFEGKKVQTQPGVTCWQKAVAIEKVGLYIPGGTAPLFSTVLMLAVPARIAGCKEIVLCTPPGRDGKVHMAWIGMVGSDAVAAVGAAAMYTWLSSGVATLARMGGQVKSAHAYGEGNRKEAVQYGKGALQLALVLAAVYGIITNLFAGPLIDFFHLNSNLVVENAIVYLRIACGLILFAFIGQTLTGLYTASGNSRTPFVANCIGMGANIVLDPLLIFGLGPIPGMGVAGAAIATVTAQFIVALVLVISMRRDPVLASQMRVWIPTPLSNIKTMVRIGFPAAIQSMPPNKIFN